MSYFSPALFVFLRELKENNDREWFSANKSRYEQDVKDPILDFIADFNPLLKQISPHYEAIPKGNGGSMFRIYRDTRFSKDKTPYKTHAAMQFRHETGKDAHAPGYYLHLEPGGVFAGGGVWHPENDITKRIRTAIAEHPEKWQAAVENDPFRHTFYLGGDSLKRPPKGYETDHPLIEDIKRKDFFCGIDMKESVALKEDFLEQYAALCRQSAAFMQFLTEALGLPW